MARPLSKGCAVLGNGVCMLVCYFVCMYVTACLCVRIVKWCDTKAIQATNRVLRSIGASIGVT